VADSLTYVERSSRHESTKIVFQLPTSRESTRASYFGCADDCCNSVSFVETARRDRGIRYRGPTLSYNPSAQSQPNPAANSERPPPVRTRPPPASRSEAPSRAPPRRPAELLKMRKAVGED